MYLEYLAKYKKNVFVICRMFVVQHTPWYYIVNTCVSFTYCLIHYAEII